MEVLLDLDGIFHNRRINTAGASIFIGFLPAAAMSLCSQMGRTHTCVMVAAIYYNLWIMLL